MKKKRRKKKQIRIILLALIIVLPVVIGTVVFLLYEKPEKNSEAVMLDEVFGLTITHSYIPAANVNRTLIPRPIKYIVIHETDNYSASAGALNHAKYLLLGEAVNGWHYTVDESSIYHHVPDNEVAYHAGTWEGNYYGIGIELCVNEGADFEQTMDNAAKLTAMLIITYDLDISAVKQHYDFSGKDCPHLIREQGLMDDFLNQVEYYLTLYMKRNNLP